MVESQLQKSHTFFYLIFLLRLENYPFLAMAGVLWLCLEGLPLHYSRQAGVWTNMTFSAKKVRLVYQQAAIEGQRMYG
jgi:hypothetical protein